MRATVYKPFMTHRPRALIIGGSVGGLFAANLLRQIGWETTVFERASEDLAGRGAAIGVTEELFEVLRRIGVQLDTSAGVVVRSIIALDHVGRIVHDVPRRPVTDAWARIYRPLKETLPRPCFRAAMALVQVEQSGAGVTAVFADGSRAEGDLLIGADGIYSTVRAQFAPAVEPGYAGYVAWRGIIEEDGVAADDRALIFDHLTFCFAHGEMMVCVPIPAEETARAGPRRCCYVWYRPTDYKVELPALCTDASGRRHGITIPPPLIRREVIAELKASAARLFPPVIAGIVGRVERPLFQAIFDLESPRMVFGRVALLGDAAFVARPHVIAGVTKAALDAQGLSAALARADGDLAGALARYDDERRAFGGKIVAHARYLGACLDPERAGRTGEPIPGPAAILRDYGAPHLLRDPLA
jgi:2-polyprenyl-6-methoxyphenol hydroxylase-like FAD-dependent oxidoreductase